MLSRHMQGPVQPSSMERACEEQVSTAIHHSTASLAGQLTDKRRLHAKILPNVQPWTRSSEDEEEVCARTFVTSTHCKNRGSLPLV